MEQPKSCPRCRLIHPPTAELCDCGYDFAARTFRPDAGVNRFAASAEPFERVVGYGLLLTSAGLLVGAVVVIRPWEWGVGADSYRCGSAGLVWMFFAAQSCSLLVLALLALLCGMLQLRR